MVFKRQFRDKGESGCGVPSQNPNKRPVFPNLARNFISRITPDDASRLEPFIRKMVREAVECAISKYLDASLRSGSSIGTSREVGFRLKFVNNLPGTLFTGSRIDAEDESPIAIELIDSRTNMRVTTGLLSSAKVVILVLDGDFGFDDGEDWTEAEFSSKIVREREGRRPLITGELSVSLREGVGYISNITFTDNSSWIRGRKFRLGARISHKVPVQARVKEAASGSFMVKDHRGEVNRKHYPPRLNDDVWRLERIAKDRIFHSRLALQGIHKVEDFLRLLETNPSFLKNIIGNGIPNRTWEAIVAHAMTCAVDDGRQYVYLSESTNAMLVLNSVYRVVKVTFDGGQTYLAVDELTPRQRALLQNLKHEAYVNINQLIPVEEPSLPVGPAWPVVNSDPGEMFLAPQVPFDGYSSLSVDSTLYGSSDSLSSQQPEVSGPQNYQTDRSIFSPTVANSFMDREIGFPSSSGGPPMFDGENDFPSTSAWNPENRFSYKPSSDLAGGSFYLPDFGVLIEPTGVAGPNSFGVNIRGGKGRSRVAWCKVRAAFWFRSMRSVAARKRMYAV